MNKNRNAKTLLFSQSVNGMLYRGFMRVVYLDCSRFKNLGKCLYITHIMISPRKGKFLNTDLKRILNDVSNIDSIYIESILSDKVLSSFIANGWTEDNNSVLLKKSPSGGKKRKMYKKNKTKKHVKKRKNKTKKI
jgi:hypothetical protein